MLDGGDGMSQDLARERRRQREAELRGHRLCKHPDCRRPIERDAFGWHHVDDKRVVCRLVTVAEPEDE